MTLSLLEHACELLRRLRQSGPLVQCITNYVSMDIAANGLLALGAAPAMVHAREEVTEFLQLAQALVINIGTLSQEWLASMEAAAAAAHQLKKPWVLDPVGCGATAYRTEAVFSLLNHHPTVIRGNASEILSLQRDIKPKGVDSQHSTEGCIEVALALSRKYECITVASGEKDLITDGTRLVWVENGHPMMTRVTAMGCTLSAVLGAFIGIAENPFEAVVAGMVVYGLCGDEAYVKAEGPGSFRVHFLDCIANITPEAIVKKGRIIEEC